MSLPETELVEECEIDVLEDAELEEDVELDGLDEPEQLNDSISSRFFSAEDRLRPICPHDLSGSAEPQQSSQFS